MELPNDFARRFISAAEFARAIASTPAAVVDWAERAGISLLVAGGDYYIPRRYLEQQRIALREQFEESLTKARRVMESDGVAPDVIEERLNLARAAIAAGTATVGGAR